jgi:hypothetical protein
MVTRLTPSESLRLITAHTTNTRHNAGIENTGNIIPIIAVAMDLWSSCDVTTRDIIIRGTAVQRSNLGALLKKSHHTKTASPKRIPPNIPIPIASGTRAGRPYLTSHCNITMTIPGHNLIGFWRVCPFVFFSVSIFVAFIVDDPKLINSYKYNCFITSVIQTV